MIPETPAATATRSRELRGSRRGLPSFALAIVFLVVPIGCGEQNEPGRPASTSAGATMTKEEVIASGDAACSELGRRARPLVDRLLKSSDRGERAGLLRQLAGAAEITVQRLSSVRPPTDGRQQLDEYVILGSEQIGVIRRAADQLDQGDQASARTLLVSALETTGKLRSLAQAYGFRVCGRELDGT